MPRPVRIGVQIGQGRRGSDVRIQNYSLRLLGGLLLLAWGVLLALHGLGLNNLPVGQLIDTWWPAPFAAWGLVELIIGLFRGGRGTFSNLIITVLFGVLLVSNLHVAHIDGWTIFWAVVLLGLGFEVLRGPGFYSSSGWRKRFGAGDVSITFEGDDIFQRHHLRNEGHLIGDIRLDLSQEQLPEGETPYDVSALIGDITILVPQDIAITVDADVSVGDLNIFGRREDGIGRHIHYESPNYAEAARKVKVHAHLMVGDITVQQF
ncbi:MAG: cell wall-active antibiotics response protein LiaF [Thermaerobacter sp.]|nr:cell wall-active antibiotics response protein LiaF [Thermaerobacter sp.]